MNRQPEQGTPEAEQARRRAQRHAARASATYRSFLLRTQDVARCGTEQAERAAIAVLCALEERLVLNEGKHLEAQLPSKLRELVHACERHEARPARRMGYEAFVDRIAKDLETDHAHALPLIRAVFQVLSELVSAGEITEVVHQLPRRMRGLWPEPVQEAVKAQLEAEAAELASGSGAEAVDVDLEVAPLPEHHAEFDTLRDRALALPVTAQLGLLRAIATPILRALAPGERHELLRWLHQSVDETVEDENALAGEPPALQ